MFNYLPLHQSYATQPTTNRKTETDFGEDFNSADALHGCTRLGEYLFGIIVPHFMAQRLASSMRPTTYASAASCKHMIVQPWKCKSYLPV